MSQSGGDTGQNAGKTALNIDSAKVSHKSVEVAVHKKYPNQSDSKPSEKDKRWNYEYVQWAGIIFFTLVAVIDRFTLNLWPLWVDSPGPTIPGNFGVSVFALIAWISSRMMLVSSSYIFLFQCRVFWNWFVEQKLPNKYLRIGDIHQTNFRIHYHVGWAFIGIPVVLHVWAVVFAAAFPQNSVKLYPNWMRPEDPESGKSIPFYADNLLSLGINDVYRIASTSITFFILIPFSIVACTRNTNWSRAQWLHLLGATIYTVDLIRMKSHPHCWVFNLPFIMWWMCDRFYAIFFYRRTVAKIVNKIHLDDKYAILYLKVPQNIYEKRTIGDVFYVNFLDPKWDRAHPFTIFWNHDSKNKMILNEDELALDWMGHKFPTYRSMRAGGDNDEEISEYIMSRASTKVEEQSLLEFSEEREEKDSDIIKKEDKQMNEGYDWDVGIIFQVFPNRVTGCNTRKTFTQEVVHRDYKVTVGLRAWGPYRSEYRMLLRKKSDAHYPKTPMVLIGTGAGCSYLIDFYQYISSNNVQLDETIHFYFSARSLSMFQWFTDITCAKHVNNLFVNAHITSHDNIKAKESTGKKSRDSKIGRLDIEDIFAISAANTQVFYCGSPFVQNIVNELTKKYKLKFHAGHSFY